MSPIPRSWILLVASIVVFLVLYTFSPRDNQTRRPGFAIVDTDAIADVATSHGNADAIKKKVIFGNYETAGPEDFLLPPVLQFARATFSPGAKIDSHAHKDMSETFYVLEGEGYVEIGFDRGEGRVETVVPLKPGIVVSLGRHAHHMFANNGTRPLTLLYFALREK